jgi:hypothetical protein
MQAATLKGGTVQRDSVEQLIAKVKSDSDFKTLIMADPVKALSEEAQRSVRETDKLIYRIVVISLGLVMVGALVGAVALTLLGKPIPELLATLGGAAIGAVAGLLAPSPVKSGS